MDLSKYKFLIDLDTTKSQKLIPMESRSSQGYLSKLENKSIFTFVSFANHIINVGFEDNNKNSNFPSITVKSSAKEIRLKR